MNSTLTRLQNWFKINCNGEWEHTYGFSIANLDNPGWTVKINLQETALENLDYKRDFQNPYNIFDWYIIRTKDKSFNIACGPDNLERTLNIFLDEIIPSHSDPKILYDIYLPLIGSKYEIWSPARGRVRNESTIELIEVPPVDHKLIKVKDIDLIDFEQKDLEQLVNKYKVGDSVEIEIAEISDGLILTVKSKKNVSS